MMVFVDTVMMWVILLLLGALTAGVIWLARNDEYFRWWQIGAIFKYHNRFERMQPEENRPLLRRKEEEE